MYHLFCANFYTSFALFAKLQDLGFGCRGTVCPLTKGIPEVANPPKNKMKKDDPPKYIFKKDQLCMVWFDKKPVTLLTTVDGLGESNIRLRSRHREDGFRNVVKPNAVMTYNTIMGGVDRADQIIQYYMHQHSSIKWWKRIFFHIMEIVLLYAHIIFKSYNQNPKHDNLQFRIKVNQGLLEDGLLDEGLNECFSQKLKIMSFEGEDEMV